MVHSSQWLYLWAENAWTPPQSGKTGTFWVPICQRVNMSDAINAASELIVNLYIC